jgi:hypothetical protein
MEQKYSVKLSKNADEFELTKVYAPPNYEEISVVTSHINRRVCSLWAFSTISATNGFRLWG